MTPKQIFTFAIFVSDLGIIASQSHACSRERLLLILPAIMMFLIAYLSQQPKGAAGG